MLSIRARGAMSTCALLFAATAALGVSQSADAGVIGAQCSGSNVVAKGATVQKLAQQNVWDPDFNTSANPKACDGTQGTKGVPTVQYESVGSGAGMEAWGINGHAFEGATAFVGTDEAPNALQRSEIESHSKNPKANTLETIPVLEGAVAIIVRLPKGCSATSAAYPGRLVFDNVTLERIWDGAITKWSEIADDGDKLSGASCVATSTITRVVRPDQAGLTSELKKYLALIDQEKDIVGELGWRELSEGAENVAWPGTVVRPAEKGGAPLVKLVNETPSSIGYANLADARANGSFTPPTGGKGTARFWVPIQHDGLEQEEETYADPSSDGDSAAIANANCVNTVYTNGEVPFPPASTLALWNEVTSSTTEANYPLCNLSYELTFHEYSQYPGTSLTEATTVNDFLLFALANNGGQTLIKGHDYLALPSSIQVEAREGAEKTKF